MSKKLFAVEVTYKAYAWVEDKPEAIDFAYEIVRTECFDVDAYEISSNIFGWHPKAYVYHNGDEDIQLKEVLVNSLPSR